MLTPVAKQTEWIECERLQLEEGRGECAADYHAQFCKKEMRNAMDDKEDTQSFERKGERRWMTRRILRSFKRDGERG